MKRIHIFTLLAALTLLLCCLLPTQAEAATSGYYTYTVSGGKATITDCSTSISGNITIPSTLGSYTVTRIDDSAFYNCSSLTGITIPDSVTSISDSAFYNCSSLTSITIPDSVTSISDSAFYNCSSLTSITIPDSVTSIGDYAFWNCSSLTSIDIPSGVTSIGTAAFSNCKRLTQILLEDGNPNYSVDARNALYNKDKTSLITFPGGITGSYTINESVTSIGANAFSGCSLTTITIPESVTSIGEGAFSSCSSLTSITIPDSVASIGDSAFSWCSSLTSITIPDSVASIGDSAFSWCSSLTSITIPDSVTSIGKGAFSGCSSLESMTIPFAGGSRRTSTDTYQYPFGYIFGTSRYTGGVATNQYYYGSSTSSATSSTYYIPSSLMSVTVTSGDILYGAFYNCDNLSSITIGNGVGSIGIYAFHGCSSLASITIPNSVTGVGNSAFYNCGNLSTVHYKGTRTEKSKISFGADNDFLKGASWHYAVQERKINEISLYYCSKCGCFNADGTMVQLQSLTIATLPAKIRYYTGETVLLEGISFVGSYSDDMQVILSADDVENVAADLSSPGRKTVTVTAFGAATTFEIIVHDFSVTDQILVDSSQYPRSSHSYANNVNETKTFTYPGAVSLVITFEGKTDVECEYDYIYVYDGQGGQIAEYTGTAAANQTLTIPGDTFKITLTSDDSHTRYGYAFSDIVANLGGEQHSPVIDPATVTCTQPGLSEGSHCEICSNVLVAQKAAEPLGHNYVDNVCTRCCALEQYHIVLTEDTVGSWSLTQDLYVDLNGFDLTGTISTNGFEVYGMDSTTTANSVKAYRNDSAANNHAGYFTCVDENGDFIVPERIYKDGEKQYMAICTEDRYSFHRFFVGVTYMSLESEVVGLCYKAAIFGDEMVMAQLAENDAFSFRVQLEGYNPVYRHFNSSELVSGDPITLRIRNYDVENYSEHNLYAQVSLTLNDGTVIETEQVALTFRWLTEQVNANYTDYTTDQLASFRAMLQQFTIVKKWDISNLLPA